MDEQASETVVDQSSALDAWDEGPCALAKAFWSEDGVEPAVRPMLADKEPG